MTRSSSNRFVAAGRAWWDRSLGGHGWRRIRELDLDTHALALCAQQVLCTAPLVVAMSAVLQRETGRSVGYVISRFLGLSGGSAADVQSLFGRTSPSISTLALVLAMVTALVFTTSVAAVQQRAFELMWTLPRVRNLRSYVRQLTWSISLGAFSIAILLASRFGRWVDTIVPLGTLAAVVLQGVLTFGFYWWSQRWLLGGRLSWKALLPGAIAIGIATTVLVRLSRTILPGQITWQVHAYGLIGAVFVLSVWLMILSAVIFGGVLIGALITERRAVAAGADPGAVEESPLTLAGLDSAARSDEENAPLGRR